MNASVYVDQAAEWAERLVHDECDGPGDWGNARRRVATRLRIPFATLWGLRYRKPKTVGANIFFALKNAIDAQRQEHLYDAERGQTISPNSRTQVLVGTADLVVGAEAGGTLKGKPDREGS